MRQLKQSSLLIIMTLLSACVLLNTQALNKNEQVWKDLAISNYEFTVYENCGGEICPLLLYPAYKVTVINDKVFSVVDVNGVVALNNQTFQWAVTFDQIFDAVNARINEQGNRKISFDKDYSYISAALTFEVKHFRVLSDLEKNKIILHDAINAWENLDANNYAFTVEERCADLICPEPLIACVTTPCIVYPYYDVFVVNGEVSEVRIHPSIFNDEPSWAMSMNEILLSADEQLAGADDPEVTFSPPFNLSALNFKITNFRVIDENYKEQALVDAAARWNDVYVNDLQKNYVIRYKEYCFCIFPSSTEDFAYSGDWVIEVIGGEISSAVINGVDVTGGGYAPVLMDGFYLKALRAKDNAYSYDVAFDAQGFLNRLTIDWDAMIVDEEVFYSDIKFSPLYLD